MRWSSLRSLRVIVALYVLALIAVAVLVDRLGDTFWPATALMFAPRWIWGAPLVVLAPLAWRRDRRPLLVPLAAAVLVLFGPILDLRLPVRRLARLGGRPRDLRVMTYNIGGGLVGAGSLTATIEALGADIVALQERDMIPIRMRGMNVRCDVELCLASRFPIALVDARDRADMYAQHGAGGIIRYELATPRGTLNVTNVHLATVRDGLAAVMHRGWRGAPALDASTRQRALEADLARGWSERGQGPVLVMGDFNTPVESAIYRRTWSPLTNAFSVAGLGFGSSKYTRWHGVRIDHVLTGPGFEVLKAWVGPGLGGDHRPVIADLRYVDQ